VIAVFGTLAGLAAIEHGVGEVLQGPVPPGGLVIRSWPGQPLFEALDGEPALTVIPNLLVSGTVTMVVAIALVIWVLMGIPHRHGAPALLGLSLVLLAVGGGFGPPALGLVLAAGASGLSMPRRRPGPVQGWFAAWWPWALAAGVVGYLGLVPGTLLMVQGWGAAPEAVVYGLMIMAFAGVVLALSSAREHDRVQAWSNEAPGPPARFFRPRRIPRWRS